MDSESKEIIKKQLKKLPKDIQDAVLAVDLAEKFKTITNKHGLRVDQGGALETETMLVMLGLEDPDDYTSNLKREADISQEEAASIAEEVNRMIFLPIRASLKRLHEDVEEEEEKVLGRIEHPSLTHAATKESPVHPQAKTIEPQTPSAIKEQLLQSSYDAEKTQTEHALDKVDKKDIFRQKLEEPVRFAKEETQLHGPAEPPAPPRPKGAKSDPYKEPIEEKDTRGIVQEGPTLPPKKSSTTPQSAAPFQTPEQKSKPVFKKASAALPQHAVAETPIPPEEKSSPDSLVQKPKLLESFDMVQQSSPQAIQDLRRPTQVKSKEQLLQKNSGVSGEKREEKITAPKWKSGRERVTAEVKSSISKPSEREPQGSLSAAKKEIAHEPETAALHKDIQQLHKPPVQTADVKSPHNNAKEISHIELAGQSPQIKPSGQPRPDLPRLDRSETDKTISTQKEAEKKEKQKPYETDPYREPI